MRKADKMKFEHCLRDFRNDKFNHLGSLDFELLHTNELSSNPEVIEKIYRHRPSGRCVKFTSRWLEEWVMSFDGEAVVRQVYSIKEPEICGCKTPDTAIVNRQDLAVCFNIDGDLVVKRSNSYTTIEVNYCPFCGDAITNVSDE